MHILQKQMARKKPSNQEAIYYKYIYVSMVSNVMCPLCTILLHYITKHQICILWSQYHIHTLIIICKFLLFIVLFSQSCMSSMTLSKLRYFGAKTEFLLPEIFFFKIYFSLVSALLPAVVLNYLPQVLILFKLSNKLHQLHISSIWSMAQTITYIHVVKLCSFCFCNNCVYCLSLPYNIKSLIL